MSEFYALNGFREEPYNPLHWLYEDRLMSRMALTSESRDVDLRQWTSKRHNQSSTNSCVGQSVVKALEIKRIMEHGHDAHEDLSVLAVYYLARELMYPQEIGKDRGTHISLACDVLRRFGVPTEKSWPFIVANVKKSPPWRVMGEASMHKIDSFYRINSTKYDRCEEVLRCLRAGNPVVYGTPVGSNWLKYRGALAKETLGIPKDVVGGHATTLVGWDESKAAFIGENSWGEGWGDGGFYTIGAEVIASQSARDFWVIQGGWEKYDEG